MWPALITRFGKSLLGKNTTEAAAWFFGKGYKNVYKKQIPPGEGYVGLSTRFQQAVKDQKNRIVKTISQKESGLIAREGKRRSQTEFPERLKAEKIKHKAAQKKIIEIASKTKNPKTGEMGYSENPTIQNIIDFSNAGGTSQSRGTFTKLQERFAKDFGKGDLRKLRNSQNKELYADFNEAFHKRRMEAQLIKQGLLDEFTPANQLLTKYGRQGWENVLDERQALTDLVMKDPNNPKKLGEIGKWLLDLGYDRNQIIASFGHDYPLKQFASLIGGKGMPNMTPFRATRLVTNPENIRAELNFMNQAKSRGIESFLYEKPLWYADDTGIMNKIMSDAQLTSKFYGPTGTRQQIGMAGKEIDPKQLLEYLKYIHKDKPFGSVKFPRTLPTRDDISALIHGKKKYNFAVGGLVGIGSKILAKLAKKLSEKELKMLMGSLWKGVDPKQAPHYKAWAKNRWGPGYKWPYKKSRIRGPEMKKSHYASLSDQAKEDLRKRYAKRLAEYIAKKKRGG